MFEKIKYGQLNHLSLGRIAEYYTKFVLTLYGLDVYTTEVDNKGIDFIVRASNGKHFDIQVKSIRAGSSGSIFIPKKNEWKEKNLRDSLILALVIFTDKRHPHLFLIPATSWLKENAVLKNRKYDSGQKSIPEWGINYSVKHINLFSPFELEAQIEKMK